MSKVVDKTFPRVGRGNGLENVYKILKGFETSLWKIWNCTFKCIEHTILSELQTNIFIIEECLEGTTFLTRHTWKIESLQSLLPEKNAKGIEGNVVVLYTIAELWK